MRVAGLKYGETFPQAAQTVLVPGGTLGLAWDALVSTPPTTPVSVLSINGKVTQGDGGQGIAIWNPTDTRTPDGGSIQSVSGIAVGRWNRVIYSGELNVKWYGAIGDGVTDDTAAINLAIAAIALAGGGTLFFPKGTYLISSTLSTPISGTIIYGPTSGTYNSFPAASIIAATDITVFHASNTIALHFHDLGFKYTGALGAQVSSSVRLTDSPYCTFERVTIFQFGIGLLLDHVHGSTSSSFACTLDHCNIISNRLVNIKADANSSANDLVVLNCQFGGNSLTGMYFADSDNLTVIGGGPENVINVGIDIDNTSNVILRAGVCLHGVHFEYTGGLSLPNPEVAAIRVGATGVVDGGSILGCIFYTASSTAFSILLTQGNCPNWIQLGNSFIGWLPSGAQFEGLTGYATKKVYSPDVIQQVTVPTWQVDQTTGRSQPVGFFDDILACSTNANAITVTLPNPALWQGRPIRLIDSFGLAGGRVITIQSFAGEAIWGAVPYPNSVTSVQINSEFGHMTLESLDGVSWWIMDGTLGSSVGPVYAKTFTTTAVGQQNYVTLPEPASGNQIFFHVFVIGVVTVAGASANVGDCIFWSGHVGIKNVGGVVSNIAQSVGTAQVYADTSQNAQASNIGFQGFSGGATLVGVEQVGAPNVGASIRWTVTVQSTSN